MPAPDVTIGSITFPTKGFLPSDAVPDEPDRLVIGRLTVADRSGTYRTPCTDFYGGLGQEFWDLNSSQQGYRSGILNGQPGYLILPSLVSVKKTDATAPITSPVIPYSAPLAVYQEVLNDTGLRTIVGLGNRIFRSDKGSVGAWTAVGTVTDDIVPEPDVVCTQITSIGVQQKVTSPHFAGKLWAAGASATGSHFLLKSTNGGATWSADTVLKGEALTMVDDRFRGSRTASTATDDQALIVARSNGTIYRTHGTADRSEER